jgi:hypothetical protein
MKERIGVDINQKLPLERAVAWAIENKVPFIDLCLDQTPELLEKSSPRAGSWCTAATISMAASAAPNGARAWTRR